MTIHVWYTKSMYHIRMVYAYSTYRMHVLYHTRISYHTRMVHTIRVWYIPYAYGINTRMVQNMHMVCTIYTCVVQNTGMVQIGLSTI